MSWKFRPSVYASTLQLLHWTLTPDQLLVSHGVGVGGGAGVGGVGLGVGFGVGGGVGGVGTGQSALVMGSCFRPELAPFRHFSVNPGCHGQLKRLVTSWSRRWQYTMLENLSAGNGPSNLLPNTKKISSLFQSDIEAGRLPVREFSDTPKDFNSTREPTAFDTVPTRLDCCR